MKMIPAMKTKRELHMNATITMKGICLNIYKNNMNSDEHQIRLKLRRDDNEDGMK